MLVESVEKTSDVLNEDNYKALFDVYIRFIMEKERSLKVAIAESVKESSSISVVMELGT